MDIDNGLLVSIWAILNSGSRGSFVGILVGLIFAFSIILYEGFKKYLYVSLV